LFNRVGAFPPAAHPVRKKLARIIVAIALDFIGQ
jgi:hypothetical protein